VAAGAWAPRLCHDVGLDIPARVKGLDTVQVTRPATLADPHMVFIDNVQGSYFRPESGIRTIVGVPCQEWDLDHDGPAVSARRSSRTGFRRWRARRWREAIAPSIATAAIATRSSDGWTVSTACISPRRSAAPDSRSRPRSASAWPS